MSLRRTSEAEPVQARSVVEIDLLELPEPAVTKWAKITTKINRLNVGCWRDDIFFACELASDFCLALGLCNALKHI
jgi:hypothetical protein